MKLTASASVLFITVLSSLAGEGHAATSCQRKNTGVYRYVVTATGVNNISSVCHKLWGGLRQFSQCAASSTSCGARGSDNHLHWEFVVPTICNSGMVEAGWWEGTENQWGGVSCINAP
jgi:hypothetical protein